MPTKRRRLANRVAAIPPGALEAWKAGDRPALQRAYRVAPDALSPFDGDLFPGSEEFEIYETLSAICPPGPRRCSECGHPEYRLWLCSRHYAERWGQD
jgi:hypothetical protein